MWEAQPLVSDEITILPVPPDTYVPRAANGNGEKTLANANRKSTPQTKYTVWRRRLGTEPSLKNSVKFTIRFTQLITFSNPPRGNGYLCTLLAATVSILIVAGLIEILQQCGDIEKEREKQKWERGKWEFRLLRHTS